MRILMVASEVPPVRSGVARAVDRLTVGARRAGHHVELRSYVDGRVWITDQARLSTVGLTLSRRETSAFDLIHLHGPAPSLSDVLLLRRRLGLIRTPMVYTHHFTVWGEPAWLAPVYRGYDAVARRLSRAASAVVTTTPSYAEHVRKIGSVGPVRVIPWGVDPLGTQVDRQLTPSTDPLRVLVLGQMRRYKGHLLALEACRGLDRVRLTLAGGGPLQGAIGQAAAQLDNVDVVVAPSDAEVEQLYRRHDIILLPSTNASEAFGIVLLEGMLRGCVPVASDLMGVSDVATPTGRVFRTGHAPGLRAALTSLGRDRPALHQLAQASAERAAGLTWDRAVQSYLTLFDEVAGAQSSPPCPP